MKRNWLLYLIILCIATACVRVQRGNETTNIKTCFCADSLQKDKLCAVLPIDVNEKFGFGYTSVLDSNFQPPFDEFSWQTFIALNWPAKESQQGLKDSTSARVWETYEDPAALFAEGDEKPLFLQVNALSKTGKKVLYLTAKNGHGKIPGLRGFAEADGKPLIDRNLNFTLYEEKVNPEETDFIRKNKLWLDANIDSLSKKNGGFSLPSSAAPKKVGALEIKAAWRILDVALGDDPSKFYTRKATIYVPAEQSVSGNAFEVEATVGLVGMHIIRKTAKFSKMIWSTFEHVDNVPDNQQQAQDQQQINKWSYYNPGCLNCDVNTPPDTLAGDHGIYKWNTTPPYAKRYGQQVKGEAKGKLFGSQITRVYPVYYRTEQVNRIWQAKLQGTVWANYRLIGSQWTMGGEGFTVPNVPAKLANVTLESFMQNNASCISCHNYASISYKGKDVKTDFSFLFGLAK